MKKTTTIIFMIMAILSVGLCIKYESGFYELIGNIILLMILCSLEIIKSLFKRGHKTFLSIEFVIVAMALFYGNTKIICLLPLLIFDLLNEESIFMSMGVSSTLVFVFDRVEFYYIFIYIVIINLYLYEAKKNYIQHKELKDFNRDEREENHKIKEKLNNLERYLEQNSIMTTLKERNFMAQKLHDHLGHRITSSLMQLEVTKETLGKDNELSEKYLVSSMENLREGMEEIREMLRAVKPRERVLGLADIKEQLLKFQYSSNMKTELKTEGDLEKITLNIWLVIEENLKEALTNIGKHANADNIRVSILVYNKILRVEIKDNGMGSDFKGEGLGLRGMRERVEAIGGRIECFNDDGFVLNMIFKLEGDSEY